MWMSKRRPPDSVSDAASTALLQADRAFTNRGFCKKPPSLCLACRPTEEAALQKFAAAVRQIARSRLLRDCLPPHTFGVFPNGLKRQPKELEYEASAVRKTNRDIFVVDHVAKRPNGKTVEHHFFSSPLGELTFANFPGCCQKWFANSIGRSCLIVCGNSTQLIGDVPGD